MSFFSIVFFVLHIVAYFALAIYATDRKSWFWTFVERSAYSSVLLTLFFGFLVWTGQAKNVFDLASFFAIFIIGAIFAIAYGFFKGYRQEAEEGHIRGAALADEREIAKSLKNVRARFSVGRVPVPVELETRGFLLAGAPGTGKSQALTAALDALRRDGARAVVADASGIYCSRYYDQRRGDVIINPFDSRCAKWSPLAEIESIADIPALAKSLVPDNENPQDREWTGYAQTLVEAIIEYCFENGLTNRDLYDLICVASVDRLRKVCAGTPAGPQLEEDNAKMFGNIRTIASSAARFLQYLDPSAGATKDTFSIRRHIAEERQGWIFLTYQQQHRDAQKSQIACVVDVAARTVLSLPPSLDRRIVFALDELPLLGRIQSIVELATNGRKHGSVIFAGIQTIAQLRDTYGHNVAQTLLACLGSWLVLRVSDSETADYMSKYIGEEEKVRIVQSGGESTKDLETSRNSGWSQQYTQSRVVLPSELQKLPDLRGLFNLAGPAPTAVVKLAVAPQHKTAEAFIPAPLRSRREAQREAQRDDAQEEKAREQTTRELHNAV